MLDKSKIGHQFEPFSADVEKGRIKFFAQSIGETNPVYFNEQAAQEAGYKTIIAPPTFPMSLDFESPAFLPVVGLLQLDIGRILHGSQTFNYYGQLYAGDSIKVTSKIKDIFDKKGGALEFVILETDYVNQDDELICQASQTLVYRNG
ncbi:MaoC family dehydratase N-terminal domain-containing protein [Thalassotalea sp. LPB0316]|uniref:MaoC family dehydratase N-terminal domain-containing protein n=1 Tax=Thalassotalea sp. LPB0316 TaxID=2769490 RepID=UPI001868B57B|nr:MaoC family dehydratase N-terminal domain-containing protein [Thalassotalea sp. LPB0316]QOL24587.1 MaoC family dehydratase N-terminal domain-containing protein [Thalassotalea sp. LPB0316]